MTTRAEIEARLARVTGELTSARRASLRATLVVALGEHLFERAVEARALVRVLPGVYAPRAVANSHAVRCHAVTLVAGGRILIAGRSALHVYDHAFPMPERVEAVMPHGTHAPTVPWLWVRRRTPPRNTTSAYGCEALTREDAVIDAWSRAAPSARKGLLYEVLWLGIATPRQVADAAARIARVPGRRALDAILAEFQDGAHSPGEVMARREVFNRPRDRVLERQVVVVAQGRRRPVDLLHRDARVAIEVDSERHHTGTLAVARDDERSAELAAEGYLTLRFLFRDLRDRPDWCRRQADRTIDGRLRQPVRGRR
ncbi:DUF559 domain-containing protein [Demequina mangrovi]|uniref:DUF559 domain-containing protein n=1 Tax=Demequina mangrovi TaxID=1043493 RepID=UPI0005A641FE|nr:DUF559 domain-containing protein [Demequina mangrovi]